jgi:Periplasmic component of the Tol biopolymer transport system
MRISSNSLVLLGIISLGLEISACARSPGVTDAAKTSAGSRMTDLQVAPATRRLHSAGVWITDKIRPSPDGRYVSFTDRPTGDLALRDLTTDSIVRLTHIASSPNVKDYAWGSLISPDGKSIAYGWRMASANKFDLRVMSLAGSNSSNMRRIAYPRPQQHFPEAQAWTPDSRNVLSVMDADNRTLDIAVIPVFGGESKRLKNFVRGYPDDMSVSPDGRWLAYDISPNKTSGDRDIFVLALDGSSESIISEENGDDFVIGWTRDGSRLLYGSERGGTPAIWAVSVANGKPAGSPVLVRSDMWRMLPLGITTTGRVIYRVDIGNHDVFTAALDPAIGQLASKPNAISAPSKTWPFDFSWSPDGQHLAQLEPRSRRPGVGGPADIVIHSLKGDEIRRLSPDLRWLSGVQWAADGSSLIVRGGGKTKNGIFAIDRETSKVRTITESSIAGFGYSLTLAADGKTAWFTSLDSAYRNILVSRLDLATGAHRIIYTIKRPQDLSGLAISPDGQQLMIGIAGDSAHEIIVLLPPNGGTPRVIYRFKPSESVSNAGIQWSREGRELVFGVVHPSDSLNRKVDMRALSISDGIVRSLGIPAAGISDFQISRDGRHIAYAVDDISSELWIMDEPVFEGIPGSPVVRGQVAHDR